MCYMCVGLLNYVHLSDGEEEYVAQDESDDTHDDTYLHHLVLFHESCGVCYGVRWCTDRQAHCY